MLVSEQESAELSFIIYRTTSIGDVVLATAGLDFLHRLPQRCHVTWLGREPALSLVTNGYSQVRALAIPKDENPGSTAKALEIPAKVDGIIDLQKNIRSRMICGALSKRVGAPVFTWRKRGLQRSALILNARLRGRAKAAPTKIQTATELQYHAMLSSVVDAVAARVNLASVIDPFVAQSEPRLPTEHDPSARAWQKELKFGHWIALAPGAAHPTKQAPLEQIVAILDPLKERIAAESTMQGGVGLVLLGDERDREFCLRLADLLQWPYSVLNLSGKLSLWESALALRESDVCLSNDSSLAHIAEAVGTPVSVLFGPTVEAFGFAPRLVDSRSFSALLGCRPCSKHGKIACRYGDQLCFSSIPAHQVGAHLFRILEQAHR